MGLGRAPGAAEDHLHQKLLCAISDAETLGPPPPGCSLNPSLSLLGNTCPVGEVVQEGLRRGGHYPSVEL